MKCSLLAGAAVGAIAFLAPQIASADCKTRLTEAAEALGTLPPDADYRIHDQLNQIHSEAEEQMASDEAACLSSVKRMEDLIRRHGGVVGGTAPLAGLITDNPDDAADGGQRASGGGGGRQGFVSINPAAPSDMESRIGALTPERQREVRAADAYAKATHALGSGIVGSATVPSEGVNRVASATNHAVEMAEAAREAMLVDRDRFSTMVQNLINRLADGRQQFELALNSPDLQAALSPTAETQLAPEKAQYAQAAQETGILARRAEEIDTANLAEGMAPGFAEAYRAMARRHTAELIAPDQAFDAANNRYQAALGTMNARASADAEAEVKAAQSRLTTIRDRHAREEDDLWREYSTMVIDLTQPDGIPQPDGRPRPPVVVSPPQRPRPTPQEPTQPEPSPEPTQEAAQEPADEPVRDRASLEQEVARAEYLLRDTERLAAKYPDDPDMATQLDYFRTRVAEARAALTNHLRDTDPEEYQRQIAETARAEFVARTRRERAALEREVASAEYLLRDAQRVAASHPDEFNQQVVNHARVRLQEANGELNSHLLEHDQAAYQQRTSEAARAAERNWADQQRTTLEQDVARAEYLLRDTERIAANYPDHDNERELALARGRVAEARGALNNHNQTYAPPRP